MQIFDGREFALQKEAEIKAQVESLIELGRKVKVGAILFVEDAGSQLYSENKKLVAKRVGIEYQLYSLSLTTSQSEVSKLIEELNSDPTITGIIIQKPTFKVWKNSQQHYQQQNQRPTSLAEPTKENFNKWWYQLYKQVDPKKDIDGLHPSTAQFIADGTWEERGRVLPATVEAVRAVFSLIELKPAILDPNHKFVIIGKSDLVGLPLYNLLRQEGRAVELLGTIELEERIKSGQALLDADTIVTATGRRDLISASMIKEGVVLIDVGEPKPDVNWQDIAQKALFITPVPGGIGPLTIVFLLQNAIKLASMV